MLTLELGEEKHTTERITSLGGRLSIIRASPMLGLHNVHDDNRGGYWFAS